MNGKGQKGPEQAAVLSRVAPLTCLLSVGNWCLLTYSAGQPQVLSSYAQFHVDYKFGDLAAAAITPGCAPAFAHWLHQTRQCQPEANFDLIWLPKQHRSVRAKQQQRDGESSKKLDQLMDAGSQKTLWSNSNWAATAQPQRASSWGSWLQALWETGDFPMHLKVLSMLQPFLI